MQHEKCRSRMHPLLVNCLLGLGTRVSLDALRGYSEIRVPNCAPNSLPYIALSGQTSRDHVQRVS